LNGLTDRRSIGLGWANSKASWITFAFSNPRETTRPKTAINSKVLQMRISRRPN
jgi:hypothetical protein